MIGVWIPVRDTGKNTLPIERIGKTGKLLNIQTSNLSS